MKITKDIIAGLNPCEDRYENYLAHYGNKEFTPLEFMGLSHITQNDKLWVAFRLLPLENVVKAATDIAESVLHIYKSRFPGAAPRAAYHAADAATYAYHAADAATYAARAAAATYATYAARAAYHAVDAATYAARAAYHAVDAAAYATVAAVDAATYAAAAVDAAGSEQDRVNREIILKHWE